jgi:hypothetical protein
MPDGSSSAAPVMSPGPNCFSQRFVFPIMTLPLPDIPMQVAHCPAIASGIEKQKRPVTFRNTGSFPGAHWHRRQSGIDCSLRSECRSTCLFLRRNRKHTTSVIDATMIG